MLTLVVRQSLSDGTVKTWKLKSNNPTYTFGSSRLADVISISPDTPGFQGVFEYRDSKWWYIDLNTQTSATRKGAPSICIEKEQTLELGHCTLKFNPVKREADLYMRLERAGQDSRKDSKKYQLYVVRQGGTVVETKLLPLNMKFKPIMALQPVAVKPVIGNEWHRETVGHLEISQRTMTLEDASRLGHLPMDQVVDEDSKKGVYFILGAALLLVTVGIFSPKEDLVAKVPPPPKAVQKIIVKTDLKPRKKRSAPAPQQVQQQPKKVVVAQANAATQPKVEMPTGQQKPNKVSNLMKSISGGRISQLLGKVSAQAAKSANVVIADGTKAGSGTSGRALASVGKMEKSGRNWGSESAGAGVTIGTAGRGGGQSASNMGALAAGGTGSGGVGLIEEESEIVGGLDRDVIAQYIKSQLGQILYCYERQLSAKPDLFGKVAVKFTIGPSGQVEQQIIGDTTLKNATVEGCILNRVAAWKFPAPQGGTKVLVTYPFLFKSTN